MGQHGHHRKRRVLRGCCHAALAVAAFAPTAGLAQEAGEVALGEVIVTAQKRAERLIDVPISVVALQGEQLEERQIIAIDGLVRAVPGLSIQSGGSGQRRISIRGVSNVFGNSSLIGVYLDEASVTTSPAIQLDLSAYDLERVEVLRGPQGTLYGEGSVGGTIRFLANQPDLTQASFKGDFISTFTKDGAAGQRLQGAANVPIIADTLGLRVAATYDNGGGWIDQPAAGRKNINGQDRFDIRTKLMWAPSDDFTAVGTVIVHRNDAGLNKVEDENGDFTQHFGATTSPEVQDDYDLYNLTLTYDLPGVRLLSTSTYIDQSKHWSNVPGLFQAAPPPAAPLVFITDPWNQDGKIFSQELRLSSSGQMRLNWTAGGFYRRARLIDSSSLYLGVPGDPFPASPLFSNTTNNLSKSWAAFGDASYDLTDQLTVGGGLRYFEDRQRLTSGTGPGAVVQSGTVDSLNPRIYVRYKLSPQATIYASASKGFRSGGFNQLGQPAYAPERVWTYEVGAKTTSLDGLTFEAALFHSAYANYQINGVLPPPAPPVSILSNAGDARLQGVEASATWRPAAGWELALSGTYIDSEFRRIDATSSTHRVGDPLDLFPNYSFTASVQHDFTLGGREGLFRVEYSQQGKSAYRNRSYGDYYLSKSAVINLLNANLRIDWSDQVYVGIFGENLLNDRGFVDPFSIEDNAVRSRPRTVGFQIGAKLP